MPIIILIASPLGGSVIKLIFAVFLIAIYIASIVDVMRSSSSKVRLLPKFVWLLIVIIIPILGTVLWIIFGRDQQIIFLQNKGNPRLPGPDDDINFLRGL